MTRQDYFEALNGQYLETAGTSARNQCVDSVNFYIKHVLGFPMIEWTNAKDFPLKADPNLYYWIKNTPQGIPQEGDIIVWDGEYGHIAVVIKATLNTITSFDQNYPTGTPCHVQVHSNYNGVKGWLRPNSAIQAQPLAQPLSTAGYTNVNFNDQTIIDLGQYGKHELQALRGFYGDALNWKKDLESNREQIRLLTQANETLTKRVRELETAPVSPSKPPQTPITLDDDSIPTKNIEWPPFLVKLWEWFKKL